MDDQRLDQDVVDGHARVERAERVLEDELQLACGSGRARRPRATCTSILRPQSSNTTRPAPSLGSADRPRIRILLRRGLAAARFADQPQALAALDVEAHVVDGADGARRAAADQRLEQGVGLADREGLGEVADLQHRRLGIEGRRSAWRPAFCCSRWPVAALISRIGCSRSPGSMSKRGTACSSALR